MKYKLITANRLREIRACSEAIEAFKESKIKSVNSITLLKKMLKEEYLEWANWLITHIMTRKQCLSYVIYAAEQVIDIYEKQHPHNNEPRKAIEAARKVLEWDSKKNRNAAAAAAADAYYATYDAYAADAVADAAYYAAFAVAYAVADADADAAYYVAYAVAYAAYYAADAVAVRIKMQRKILRYGIKLLKLEV